MVQTHVCDIPVFFLPRPFEDRPKKVDISQTRSSHLLVCGFQGRADKESRRGREMECAIYRTTPSAIHNREE